MDIRWKTTVQLQQMEQLLAELAFATMVSPFDGECQEAWEGEGGGTKLQKKNPVTYIRYVCSDDCVAF